MTKNKTTLPDKPEPENKIISTEKDKENTEKIKKHHKKSRINVTEQKLEVLEKGEIPKTVIYIGHLPWGFNDDGIKKYFSQFGEIDKIFQPRSRKVILS